MTFDLAEIAAAAGSPSRPGSAPISGWSVDSRTVSPGDLFFALRGANQDGHAYLAQVFQKGAAAAVVDRPVDSAYPAICVPDTLEALQKLAAWARLRWNGRIVGVTGSAGKTTTKETIAQCLSAAFPVGKTTGNFNNHVGLPLSLLRIPQEAQAAVIEMGMNHAGEIRSLASIARPDIGVVTNIGYAHVEHLGSIEGIARAKRELIEALPPHGTAVLNADDTRVAAFRDVHPENVLTFGLSGGADVRPEQVGFTPDGVRFRLDGVEFESALVGRHGLLNILAGIAVARVFGIAAERLREAVRSLTPGKMRGERFTHAGITVFNDCYNSNPDAARSMLDVLRDTPARRRVAVLGEMLELGRWSEALHQDVGLYATRCGINVLVGIRGAARQMIDAAIRSGLPADAALFYEDPSEAGSALRSLLQKGDAVLFKGSRGTRVEKALEKFLE
jgi:UDP-N-acetylmuramoyl-tripeptide--D-alanyl-D-alanine ligase